MHQGEDRLGHKFLAIEAEGFLPGRIELLECALEVRDVEHVQREIEEPIPFILEALALGNVFGNAVNPDQLAINSNRKFAEV